MFNTTIIQQDAAGSGVSCGNVDPSLTRISMRVKILLVNNTLSPDTEQHSFQTSPASLTHHSHINTVAQLCRKIFHI